MCVESMDPGAHMRFAVLTERVSVVAMVKSLFRIRTTCASVAYGRMYKCVALTTQLPMRQDPHALL